MNINDSKSEDWTNKWILVMIHMMKMVVIRNYKGIKYTGTISRRDRADTTIKLLLYSKLDGVSAPNLN